MAGRTLSHERARTALRELDFVSDTLRQISRLSGVGAMPVTVISSDRWIDKDHPELSAAARAEWNKRQQRNWLAISANSRFLIVPESDHLSLLSKMRMRLRCRTRSCKWSTASSADSSRSA
jgi:hypothetical protein